MRKLKYKIGDVVKIKKVSPASIGVPDGVLYRIGIILKTDDSSVPYRVTLINYSSDDIENDISPYYWFTEDCIELYRQKITSDILYNLPLGSIIITDEDYHNEYVKTDWSEFTNDNSDTLYSNELTDNLVFSKTIDEPKLVEIREPVYFTTYNRNSEPVEMTIEEISEELGYNIKIVKSK